MWQLLRSRPHVVVHDGFHRLNHDSLFAAEIRTSDRPGKFAYFNARARRAKKTNFPRTSLIASGPFTLPPPSGGITERPSEEVSCLNEMCGLPGAPRCCRRSRHSVPRRCPPSACVNRDCARQGVPLLDIDGSAQPLHEHRPMLPRPRSSLSLCRLVPLPKSRGSGRKAS